MRIFDFIGQTFLFLVALLCLMMGHEAIIFIGLLQFFVGLWQIISAIAMTANRGHGDPLRTLLIRIYWIAVGVYFIVLVALGMVSGDIAIVWFFSAWLIAIFYYIITIRIAFVNTQKRTFLDIANE